MRSDKTRHFAILVLFTVSLAGAGNPVSGSEQTMRFDPEATKVLFELGAVLHTVHGTAKLASGEVRFDPVSGEASGRVVVDARSLDTGNASRDEKMHGKVLESERYPEIVLAISGFTGRVAESGPSDVLLDATIHLHGEAHTLELPVVVEIEGVAAGVRSATSARSAHVATTFTVPYVEWGLKNPSTVFLKVKKQVEISIEATAILLP